MNWLKKIKDGPTSRYLRNVETQVVLKEIEGETIPLTVNESEYDNAFVCSPLTQYLRYPKEELKLLKLRPLEQCLGFGISRIEGVFRSLNFNQVVQFNNWLMTTNSWLPSLTPEKVIRFSKEIISQYPEYALLIRCLPANEIAAYRAMNDNPFHFFKVREVYYFDGTHPDYLNKEVVKRDRKLLLKDDYEVLRGSEVPRSESQRLIDLYSQLYLEKHSRLNPEFTRDFVELCMDEGPLEFIALRSRVSHRIDAIMGLMSFGGELTVPFMGYDTSLPQELGLYRRLFILALIEAADRKVWLNFSSGAGDFKRRRGGERRWEYSAFAVGHLKWPRRWPWKIIQSIANSVGPIVMKKA